MSPLLVLQNLAHNSTATLAVVKVNCFGLNFSISPQKGDATFLQVKVKFESRRMYCNVGSFPGF